MHERPVRRVHQPDDGVVDRSGKGDALGEIGIAFLVEAFKQRDFRRSFRVLAKKYPDVPLHLASAKVAGMDAVGREGLTRHQRRYQGASPARVESPTVIAAFDLMSIKATGTE